MPLGKELPMFRDALAEMCYDQGMPSSRVDEQVANFDLSQMPDCENSDCVYDWPAMEAELKAYTKEEFELVTCGDQDEAAEICSLMLNSALAYIFENFVC